MATTQAKGRGGGVGRCLGVGEHLPVHGVSVAVAVGVALGVAVGVEVTVGVNVAVGDVMGVGVGPACTSNDPTSSRPFLTRSKPGPRWSYNGGGVKFGSPALIAGLPGNNA